VKGRRALVVGGTGMLAPAVRALAEEGHQVFLPSRAPRPELPGTWIRADWSDPPAFARAVRRGTGDRPVDLLVLWAHRPHRSAIAPLLRPLARPDTVVVEAVGSAQYRETGTRTEFERSRLVVLGSLDGRWLTHPEISDGVLTARHDPPGAVRYVGAVP
jgi:NAD(P)-dependent dehydrogenase (short-subunit alcohol dehydrogenase family)